MKRIGIVILATNAYFVLGVRFIKKFMHHYHGESSIKFYFFSDEDPANYLPDNIDVAFFNQSHTDWVSATNSKFKNVVEIKEQLINDVDYVYYFDADTSVSRDFTEEWFLGDLVGGEHYGNRSFLSDGKGFDRNPIGHSYVPLDSPLPYTYHYGAFFGGTTENTIKFCETLTQYQIEDQAKGYEPPVNDESYINAYFHFNPPTYSVPCEKFAFDISDKGGLGETRNTKLDVSSLKQQMLIYKNKPFDVNNGIISEIYTRSSSYELSDDHLSAKYSNLYIIDGKITYLTTKPIDLPNVSKWQMWHVWKPEIKLFNSNKELENFVIENQKGHITLSVVGDNIWYGNIGHALWDGLYAQYLALVKFGYIDDSFVLMCSDWSNKQSMAYDVITKFSRNVLMEHNNLPSNEVIKLDTLVVGALNTGNTVMNKEYTLYGQQYNGMKLFKERMLKSYNIEKKPTASDKQPKIIIINNKRFSDDEKKVIHQVIDMLKPSANIKFIDWYHDYNSFADQLKELEDVDIHVTGPGTGMMYMPFLKEGAVNINLGYIEKCQSNSMRPNIKIENYDKPEFEFPGWMEQAVCAACADISTLYYDRWNHPELEIYSLFSIILEAMNIIKEGEIRANKHNLDAQVFIEYCKRTDNPEQICQHLTNMALFIELFVNEHPSAISPDFVNLDLLRQIKTEFGLKQINP
jgi:hypothetical protein